MTSELMKQLDQVDLIQDSEWQATLCDRKLKELEFHDKDRDEARVKESVAQDTYEKFYGNKKYYNTVKRSTAYIDDWIAANTKGKVFLDYACGNGVHAIKAAKAGA